MTALLKNKLLLLLLSILCSSGELMAQNGMFFDPGHGFLIPMLENNVMKGHAYIYEIDKVSRDSNRYMIDVYDEYLHDVGQKTLTIDSKWNFTAAVYNGTNIVTRFERLFAIWCLIKMQVFILIPL